MVHVPGGTFMMGSNNDDQDSRPAHTVTVRPFFLDSTEVSCEQYKKFLDATGRPAPAAWTNGSYPDGAARLPVTGVSWNDADAYARWAGKRLPTEEEWELAARGPDSLKYPWGNAWKAGCANADEEGSARKRMAEVGSHKCTSPFGTDDMIGNAWEWTASDWVQYPGGRLQYPTKGNEKVIRGGSWESSQEYASGVYRSGIETTNDKSGYKTTGFRCAKDSQ
jgi:formylglycine-generating enzyme required for sulfatase activity